MQEDFPDLPPNCGESVEFPSVEVLKKYLRIRERLSDREGLADAILAAQRDWEENGGSFEKAGRLSVFVADAVRKHILENE